ncbi:MAG: hypothetical protein M0036_11645 [Desulfobacteraceae bacterium]|nr:hypothetical protein [Desulfobacteraceae bacterium]
MFRLKEDQAISPLVLAIGLVMLVACLAALACGQAWALGTPAGTVITNTAQASYTLGSDPTLHTVSASHNFRVLEVIDAVVVWRDSANVSVNSPQTGAPLTFLLTNTGNGPERYTLAFDDAVAGDQFDPATQQIWLESNGVAGLQTTGAVPDTLYQPGVNDPALASDGAATIYLFSNIPAGQNNGSIGQARAIARSATSGAAGATPGTVLAGAGQGGVDAIVGHTGAAGQATGAYLIASTSVQVVKTIQRILDPSGGNQPYPGARVTYRLSVSVSGSGTATGLVITDPIPANTTYAAGTILLDSVPQTDAADGPADRSDFNVTNANAVTVNIGDMAAPAGHTIEFTTIIN